jgi:hypothetical protein
MTDGAEGTDSLPNEGLTVSAWMICTGGGSVGLGLVLKGCLWIGSRIRGLDCCWNEVGLNRSSVGRVKVGCLLCCSRTVKNVYLLLL